MNQLKRFLFQVLIWSVIWAVVWFFLGSNSSFLQQIGFPFLFQILTIGILIYYTAPQFFFKKKYLLFVIVSVIIVALFSNLIPDFISLPNPDQLPGRGSGPGPRPRIGPEKMTPRTPPPKYLINLLTIGISYILATFIETFIFAKKKEEETIRNTSENLKTELKFLKSQINPHFLFNSLNNIYALSAIDAGKTQRSISYLSDMLRYVLYECDQEEVPLDKEITYIENYIKLFSLKSSKVYPITTKFNIANRNLSIAPMLLIPFMENALKHGNIEKISEAYIRIQIDADEQKIAFAIENSKSKIPVITDEVGGIGIENVKKRLAILYPNRHELLINETTEAFKVNLNIDLDDNS